MMEVGCNKVKRGDKVGVMVSLDVTMEAFEIWMYIVRCKG